MLKYGIGFILIIIISSCTFEGKTEVFNPDYEPKISVFGIISTDESQECVIVERTLRLNEDDETNGYDRVNPIIDDAIVQIISDQDTVQFTFQVKQPDSLYFRGKYLYKGMYLDVYNEFQAQAGKTYTLQVKVPDGRTVTGVTTVPNHPTITKPETNEIIEKQTIKETTIQWLDDSNSIAYVVEFYVTIVIDDSNYFSYDVHNIEEDNLIYHSSSTLKNIDLSFFYIPVIHLSDTATVKVLALDQNIYDYASKSNMATLTGTDLNLLEGGVGVFGSISTDSVKVILQ